MPDLSIIIVTYNNEDTIIPCLDSIFANSDGLAIEVIVVDSASPDRTVEIVEGYGERVRLLAQDENVGFTRGNNIGLAVAVGRHNFLLNPDTEIIGDAMQTMVAYLDAHAEVGIVGSHTLNTDGTTQSTRRRFPTQTLAFFESTWLQPFAPSGMLERFYVSDQPDNGVYAVDWVQGSALMARREIYEQIGGLDTGYVMYFEELDWCKRAKAAGWHVMYVGNAQIIHHGGVSSDQVGAWKHIYFQQSKIRYYRKYHGALFAAVLRGFLLLTYGWQLLIEGTKAAIGHKREMRLQRLNTYRDVLAHGLRRHE